MKHARIIMAMLVLLGAASLAEAQIVVSSTTASTTHIRSAVSGRTEGLVIRPDMEIGVHPEGAGLFIHNTIGYQFNPIFFLGGGLGWDHDFSGKASLPIFVDFRAYFCDKKWSPFFDLKLGYNIPTVTKIGYGDVLSQLKMTGIRLGGTLGMQYQNFDFGVSVVGYHVHYWNYDSGYNSSYSYDDFVMTVMLNFAYNFQLKKK